MFRGYVKIKFISTWTYISGATRLKLILIVLHIYANVTCCPPQIVGMHARPDISLVSVTHQKKISWNGITFQDDKKYKTLSSGS